MLCEKEKVVSHSQENVVKNNKTQNKTQKNTLPNETNEISLKESKPKPLNNDTQSKCHHCENKIVHTCIIVYQSEPSEAIPHIDNIQIEYANDIVKFEPQSSKSETSFHIKDSQINGANNVIQCEPQSEISDIISHTRDIETNYVCESQSVTSKTIYDIGDSQAKPHTNPPIHQKSIQKTTKPKPPTQVSKNPPKLNKEEWKEIDEEFKEISKVSWESFKKGLITPEQYITDVNVSLASFLESKPEFQKETKEFYKHDPTKSKAIIDKAKTEKIMLNKKAREPAATLEDKAKAKQAIRMYSHVLKVHKEREQTKLAN